MMKISYPTSNKKLLFCLACMLFMNLSYAVTVNATYVMFNSSIDSIMYDNVTGKFHGKTWGNAECQASSFSNYSSLEANSPYHTAGIGSNHSYNTYFEANNGKFFGQYGYSAPTIGRWNAETKALEKTVTIPNANHDKYFNWTGHTEVNVFFDGLAIYALTGDSAGSGGWRLTKLDQELNVLDSKVFQDSSIGHAFMINGKFFTSNSYDNFSFNQVFDFVTGSYSVCDFAISPNYGSGTAGSNYMTDSAYDAANDVMYFSRWGYIYKVDSASATFNATSVPEPSALALLGIGILVFLCRRGK